MTACYCVYCSDVELCKYFASYIHVFCCHCIIVYFNAVRSFDRKSEINHQLQTDTPPIAKSRSSIAECDRNRVGLVLIDQAIILYNIPPTPETSSFPFSLCHCLVTHLSASDSFPIMALYKSTYLLTYLLT